MANYTPSVDFAAKDDLTTGDPAKIVKGTEISSELTAIQTAVNSKADSASPTFTGSGTAVDLAVSGILDSTGTLQIGGVEVTATAAELNKVDGFTGTVDDLNYAKDLRATGVTATEFDYLDGVDSTLYRKTNILGTVSQSSGVPTGAIVERGSNANGEYVKFADGTMIAVTPRRSVDCNISRGSGFNSEAISESLPATFANALTNVATAATESQIVWANFNTNTSSSISGRLHAWTSETNVFYRVLIVGRWF